MTFSKTQTSEEPGLEMARRIGFLVLKISSIAHLGERRVRRHVEVEGVEAHVARDRAELVHLLIRVRVLAADGRAQQRRQAHAEIGVALLDQERVLGAAARDDLDVEAGLLSQQLGHAARDRVPAAAHRSGRPRQRLLRGRAAARAPRPGPESSPRARNVSASILPPVGATQNMLASARSRPAAKRSRVNAPISMLRARPSRSISVIRMPIAGECMKPCPEKPHAT